MGIYRGSNFQILPGVWVKQTRERFLKLCQAAGIVAEADDEVRNFELLPQT